jgi:hypothetical protein
MQRKYGLDYLAQDRVGTLAGPSVMILRLPLKAGSFLTSWTTLTLTNILPASLCFKVKCVYVYVTKNCMTVLSVPKFGVKLQWFKVLAEHLSCNTYRRLLQIVWITSMVLLKRQTWIKYESHIMADWGIPMCFSLLSVPNFLNYKYPFHHILFITCPSQVCFCISFTLMFSLRHFQPRIILVKYQ